jgi:alpha-glucosidase
VDAIWLSPFYRSPMADFGYDVSDYCDVDPTFGTLEDFDHLVSEAHEAGLKVIVDWVPNHTSDQHPWFADARSSRQSEHRDWYVWRDSAPDGGPPNNWIRAWGGTPAWTFDEASGQWYLHLFLPEQPDLNWRSPGVVDAMHDVLRFWLDRGVDGFRMDVLHCIGKDEALPDDPAEPGQSPIPHCALNDDDTAHALIAGLRDVLEEYPGDRMMVGEIVLPTGRVATYYGDGRGVHLSFNFPPLHTRWRASSWRRRLAEVAEHIEPVGWPTWVLSNHDNPRHRTRYGSEAQARAAAVLLLTLRGTPFLYAGEELGLEDGVIPTERIVDPGGRDGCRSPIPWDSSPEHGWGTADPWLPWPPDAGRRNAETQHDDPSSILHLYRRLLALRHASPALQVGDQRVIEGPLPLPDDVVGWERRLGDEHWFVLVNFGTRPVTIDQAVALFDVEISSDGEGQGEPFSGHLAADAAVLLRPRV